MTFIVDQLFPPIVKSDDDGDNIEFTSFNYWREPIGNVEFELDIPTSSGLKPEKESKEPANPAAASANALQIIQSTSLPTIPENWLKLNHDVTEPSVLN